MNDEMMLYLQKGIILSSRLELDYILPADGYKYTEVEVKKVPHISSKNQTV
jgi:hypothetical protein